MSDIKVVAINGSPRKNGNTSIMVNKVFEVLEREGIKTEEIQLAGNAVRGCTACYVCKKKKDGRCAIGNDMVNYCIEKMDEADGIILASPTYFASVSTELKAIIDRTGVVARATDFKYKRKIGAAIVTARRAGQVTAFDTINHYFLANQMMVVGASYWNMGIGKDIGDVNSDSEGLENMQTLGENMAWLLKCTKS